MSTHSLSPNLCFMCIIASIINYYRSSHHGRYLNNNREPRKKGKREKRRSRVRKSKRQRRMRKKKLEISMLHPTRVTRKHQSVPSMETSKSPVMSQQVQRQRWEQHTNNIGFEPSSFLACGTSYSSDQKGVLRRQRLQPSCVLASLVPRLPNLSTYTRKRKDVASNVTWSQHWHNIIKERRLTALNFKSVRQLQFIKHSSMRP